MRYTVISLVLVLFSMNGYSQEMGYNIFGTYSKSVQSEQLKNAKSLSDINAEYPASWIKKGDYLSSEIQVRFDGNTIIASGENDILTFEQIAILGKADLGSNIDIVVNYYKVNSITKSKNVETMKFSVSLVPEQEAEFVGGEDKMMEYLKTNAVDRINESSNNKFEMAKVRFVVNEIGAPMNPQIILTSEDNEIDKLLLNVISNMPAWKPAQSSDGVKVKQEFEFVVGMMIGC